VEGSHYGRKGYAYLTDLTANREREREREREQRRHIRRARQPPIYAGAYVTIYMYNNTHTL